MTGWRRIHRLVGVMLLLVGACDGPAAPPTVTAPGRVEVMSGNGQIGTVGRDLAQPIVVHVIDNGGTPIPDQPIEFRVTAGDGRLDDVSATTDGEGRASARWILGTAANAIQKIEIRPVGDGFERVVRAVAQAVGRPAIPAAVTPTITGARSGQAGAAISDPIEVQVTDEYGNALPGVTVNWTVRSGGGSVQPSSTVTDAAGMARVAWTLGSVLGAGHVLEAAAGPSARTEVIASVALPANLSFSISRGNNQTTAIGRALPSPLQVRLLTSTGSPIAGAAVTWSAGSSSGALSPVIAVTNSDGRAEATFTAGRVVGSHQIVATVDDRAAVTFKATATACPVALLSIVRGNGQAGRAGTTFGAPLVVRVADTEGGPVLGAAVSWTGQGTVSTGTTVSSSSGEASVQWTPGNVSGTQTMTARIGCSDATFSASVRKRVATVAVSPANPQVVVGGGARLTAVLRDEDGRILTGVPVTWTSLDPSVATVNTSGAVQPVAVGSAVIRATAEGVSRQVTVRVVPPPREPTVSITVTPSNASIKVGASVRLTATPLDADGDVVRDAAIVWSTSDPEIATVAANGMVSGVSVGEARIQASADGVTRSVTVGVTPAGAPGVPVMIEIASGNGQTGLVGAELEQQLVALVTDSDGNPVANAFVYWEGDGLSFVSVTSTTSEGITRNYWMLDSAPGSQQMELYIYDFASGTRGARLGVFTATGRL